MKVETNKLMTVKNYAYKFRLTPSYIYKLIRDKKITAVSIDEVLFIDIAAYPKPITK